MGFREFGVTKGFERGGRGAVCRRVSGVLKAVAAEVSAGGRVCGCEGAGSVVF